MSFRKEIFLGFFLFGFSVQLCGQSGLEIDFHHKINGGKLVLNQTYTSPFGEEFKPTLLSYFVSNISLQRKDGTSYTLPQDSSYFLIKLSENFKTTKIELNDIPPGKYTGITFTIGIDSLRNTLGIDRRGGNLDVGGVASGMYWVWNSGYIFFKLEGKSPLAPERTQHQFTYHIGGFGGYKTKTINSIRATSLKFKKFRISKRKKTSLVVEMNLERFFEGAYDLKIAYKPAVMWGRESEQIADNYIGCFEAGDVNYTK